MHKFTNVDEFLKEKGIFCQASKGVITSRQCAYSRVRGQRGKAKGDVYESALCDTKCGLYISPSNIEKNNYDRVARSKKYVNFGVSNRGMQ